ncbi:hypothetical protein Acor_01570 [Acrocarpospora corrugata]|uniref:Uncharacterized protein n=1 Tax=Acrocarpospora corrugata TaxID=35763 RepID=A0A5M3VN67_9ACTN|nr:hypothetical protein [Acrocarpospora corrugata]GER98095.1 hypothetical protein Acor_01570 [Acrocarpospora corrugata]
MSRLKKQLSALVVGLVAATALSATVAAPAQAMPREVGVFEWCYIWETGYLGQCLRWL